MRNFASKLCVTLIFTLVISCFNYAEAKLKITPSIEFSGKSKDKMPYGEGTLTFNYTSNNAHGVKFTGKYGEIKGFFDGGSIKNATVSGMHFENTAHGDFAYSIYYDKNAKMTTIKLRMDKGTFGDIEVSDLPVITYTQDNLKYPSFSFEEKVIQSSTINYFERIDWVKQLGSVSINSTVFDFTITHPYQFNPLKHDPAKDDYIGLMPKGYILANGYNLLGENLKYGLVTPKGSMILQDYYKHQPEVKIVLSDGTTLYCSDKKEIKKYGSSDWIHTWSISSPANGSYTGTVTKFGNILPTDLMTEYQRVEFPSYIAAIEGAESIKFGDIQFNDGVLLKSTGEKDIYHLGQAESETSIIKNNPPQIVEVKTPGSLLSSIPPEELKKVQNLAIVGYLDDNDLKVLTDLGKNLLKLDLSLAYTTLSNATKQERQANAAALASLFGAMGDMADAKRKDRSMTSMDHAYVKSFTDMVQKAAADVKISDSNCVIPQKTLSNLPKLEDLILPIWCSKIESYSISNLPQLVNVQLPPKLKYIGEAFVECPKLKTLQFPSTITDIDNKSFTGTRLDEADLSECDYHRLGDWGLPYRSFPTQHKVLWRGLPTSKLLKLPKNIECLDGLGLSQGGTLYLPETVEYSDVSLKNMTIYCKSQVPFKVVGSGDVKNCTLYVPKGSMTAWYAKYGDNNKIIEY